MVFQVFGIPEPKGSTRAFVRQGHVLITSANRNLKQWETNVRVSALLVGHVVCAEGPVRVEAAFVMPRPKTVKKGTSWHTKRPDLDKLLRAICDALTGVAWRDDSQVCVVACSKRLAVEGEPSGVLVTVEQL